jgi:hypothetical protein
VWVPERENSVEILVENSNGFLSLATFAFTAAAVLLIAAAASLRLACLLAPAAAALIATVVLCPITTFYPSLFLPLYLNTYTYNHEFR